VANLTFKTWLLNSVNSVLSITDVKVVRRSREFDDFIPLQATLRRAQEAGLSVSDYIDINFNAPGATQTTIDQMAALDAFANKPQRICEIGPGSGRYLEKVKLLTSPQHYEIYETSAEWRNYLVQKYGVVARHCNGKTLAETPTASVDLLHSHKVFEGLPLFTTYSYFAEIVRVVPVGGKVAFDVITENCLDDTIIEGWLGMGEPYAKSMVPQQLVVDYFGKRGFRFDGAFKIVMGPGFTQYFVFTRIAAAS
jgi:hypothetical protein